MAEESTAQKVDTDLAVAIVRSYVAKNNIAADQLGDLIGTVHRTLSGLGTNVPPPVAEALTPAVPIRRSVPRDHVVCLECGFRGHTLRRHAGAARSRCRRLSRTLEIVAESSGDGPGIFGGPLGNGKAARLRARSPAGCGRGTARASAARTPTAGVDELGKDGFPSRRLPGRIYM
jgi:hypothetical protein